MKSNTARVNIISKEIKSDDGKVIQEAGMLMRTTRSYAEKCIAAGTHTYTTKSKLKSFLNKQGQLTRTFNILNANSIDVSNAPKKALFRMPSGNIHIVLGKYRDKNSVFRWKTNITNCEEHRVIHYSN